VTLLLFYSPLNPEVLWEKYRDDMSHDMRHRRIMNGGIADNAYPTTPRGQISVDEQRLA